MALPNIVDLKTHLNIPLQDTGDDDELQMMLDAALDVVESIVGPISASPVTETHYGVSSPVLVLRRVPVLSVTSISSSGASSASVSDYVLDPDLGTLRLASGLQVRGDVTVSYQAGRVDVPRAILLATLTIAAHQWVTQRGPQPTPVLAGPDDGFGMAPSMGYAIPNRAIELLQPYAQARVA